MSSPTTAYPQTDADEATRLSRPLSDAWVAIVWNDPVNLMSYVSYVFQTYFGYSPQKADELMLQVHHEGKSAVSFGGKEKIETDIQAMHTYGLWATMQRDTASA